MNDDARHRLRDAYSRHGAALFDDANAGADRVREELGAEFKREGFWLASAIEAGVPRSLLSSPRGEPVDAVISRLAESLSEELGLAPEPARWAVQSWAETLGLAEPQDALPADATRGTSPSEEPAEVSLAPEVTQAFSPEELSMRESPAVAPGPEREAPAIRPDPDRSIPPADRDRAEQWLREANVLNKQGRWAEAVTRCKQSLHVNPNDVFGWQLLGDLHAELGELDQAEQAYRDGLTLDPARASLEERLGRILVIREEQERERIKEEILGGGDSKPAFDLGKRRNTISLLIALILLALGLVLMLVFVQSMDRRSKNRDEGLRQNLGDRLATVHVQPLPPGDLQPPRI